MSWMLPKNSRDQNVEPLKPKNERWNRRGWSHKLISTQQLQYRYYYQRYSNHVCWLVCKRNRIQIVELIYALICSTSALVLYSDYQIEKQHPYSVHYRGASRWKCSLTSCLKFKLWESKLKQKTLFGRPGKRKLCFMQREELYIKLGVAKLKHPTLKTRGMELQKLYELIV